MTSNAAIQSDIIRKTYPATHLSRCQRKSIFGVGINNADYITQPCAGKFRLTDPAYKAWKLMMSRCYNGKVHGVRPTYIRATVCEEWREFMTFRAWWISNHIDGFHLDKDLLLAGNKEYSPNKCIFIPAWLNSITSGRDSNKKNKIGAYAERGRFVSMASDGTSGNAVYLGSFKTEDEAHHAWMDYRMGYAESKKAQMDEIDERIYKTVKWIIQSDR
jgi:hypothetical protein